MSYVYTYFLLVDEKTLKFHFDVGHVHKNRSDVFIHQIGASHPFVFMTDVPLILRMRSIVDYQIHFLKIIQERNFLYIGINYAILIKI